MVNWRIYVDKERDDFNAKVKKRFPRIASRYTAFELLEVWRHLVEQCAQGYDDYLVEYENDISTRDQLHAITNMRSLQRSTVMQELKDELEAIDQRFKKVLIPAAPLGRHWLFRKHWWLQSVPSVGRGVFVEDVKRAYGISIRDVDDED